MLAPDDVKLKGYSVEEYEKYCVFDEDGFICGVKEDAPDEFKEAYEHDKKLQDERDALGID